MAPQSNNNTAPDPSSATFTCKHCIRRFDTLQALRGHQRAHVMEQAIAKKNRIRQAQRRKAQRNPNYDRDHHLRGVIGLCEPCMRATPFGAQVTKVIEGAYYQRMQQLVFRAVQLAGDDTINVQAGTGTSPSVLQFGSWRELHF